MGASNSSLRDQDRPAGAGASANESAGASACAGAGTTRRAVITWAPLAGSAAFFAACGGTPGGQTVAAPAPSQPTVELRYACSAIAAQAPNTYDDARVKMVEAFNTQQRASHVTIEWKSGIVQAVTAQVAGGDAPDLVHAHPWDTLGLMVNGSALALDPYLIKEKKNIPDVTSAALDYWILDGKRYALPNNYTVQAMYFNKGLFEKLGLKTPDQHEKDGTWTIDIYLDLARKLTSGTGETKVWGAPFTSSALDIQLAFIWPFGGDLWDKTATSTLLDSKESVEAIQFMADLTGKLGVSPTPDEVKTLPRAVGGAISTERGGMEVLTTDVLGLLTPTTFAKGMAPMPKGRAGRVVRGAPIGIHLMKGSKQLDAAWDAANFQSGLEAEKLMLQWRITVPWHKSTLTAPATANMMLPWESAAYYTESVNKTRPTAYPPSFVDINRLYGTAFAAVRDGQKSAQLAVTEIRQQVNDLLKKK